MNYNKLLGEITLDDSDREKLQIEAKRVPHQLAEELARKAISNHQAITGKLIEIYSNGIPENPSPELIEEINNLRRSEFYAHLYEIDVRDIADRARLESLETPHNVPFDQDI